MELSSPLEASSAYQFDDELGIRRWLVLLLLLLLLVVVVVVGVVDDDDDDDDM